MRLRASDFSDVRQFSFELNKENEDTLIFNSIVDFQFWSYELIEYSVTILPSSEASKSGNITFFGKIVLSMW